MRVLITGSRHWTDARGITEKLDRLYSYSPLVVVHGGARGADSIAAEWVREWERFHQSLTEEVHPANWDAFGRSAGHRRNAEMVNSGIDLVLAFPLGDSPGTRGCIAMARKAQLPVNVYEGV